MVAMVVNGNQVGTMADAEKLLVEFAGYRQEIEFRDASGVTIGRFIPEPVCPWNPNLTRADLDRMSAEGGGTSLAEFWKRMGVK